MLNVVIAYANAAGARWVDWVLAGSLEAVLLLALIGLVWFVIRKRVAPQVGYGLFLLVPLKLLAPVAVTVPAAMAQWTPSAVISSWCRGALSLKRVESQSRVDTRMAGALPDQPAGPESGFPPLSRPLPVVADSPALTSPSEIRSTRPIAPTMSSLARSVTETPRLSVSAIAMIAWLLGALLLFGRFAAAQLRFCPCLRHLCPVDESTFGINVRELCWLAGVPQTVPIVETDGIALSLSRSTAVESGEAFVRILRHADHGRRGLEGALGVFGLDSRACCLRRLHRLLDTDGPIRVAPGSRSIWALILLAIVSVPHLGAAGDALPANSKEPTKQLVTKDQPGPKAAAAEPAAKKGKEFELRLVDPGGQSIPRALVELCSSPVLTAQQVRQGAFVRQESYGAIVATDAEGRLVVEPPNKSDYLNVYIRIPGYGPYWAGWTSAIHAEPVPRDSPPSWSRPGRWGESSLAARGRPSQARTSVPVSNSRDVPERLNNCMLARG